MHDLIAPLDKASNIETRMTSLNNNNNNNRLSVSNRKLFLKLHFKLKLFNNVKLMNTL